MKRQIKNAKKFNNRPRFFGLSPQTLFFWEFLTKLKFQKQKRSLDLILRKIEFIFVSKVGIIVKQTL